MRPPYTLSASFTGSEISSKRKASDFLPKRDGHTAHSLAGVRYAMLSRRIPMPSVSEPTCAKKMRQPEGVLQDAGVFQNVQVRQQRVDIDLLCIGRIALQFAGRDGQCHASVLCELTTESR
jgi:hypothetical protein